MDAIGELGDLASSRGIGLHVDNCLGGFLLSFMQREGRFSESWDFAVPGVTTISVDLHKYTRLPLARPVSPSACYCQVVLLKIRIASFGRYGCASKGVSVCAFRDPRLRQLTYVPCVDGCEGLSQR